MSTRTTAPEVQRFRSALRALLRRFSVSERADTSCCGMTVAQAATLEALGSEGATRLGTLGKRLGISPSTLTRNVARLEQSGAVARTPDPEDSRAFRVSLTQAGRAAAGEVERQQQQFARGVLERLPPERRRRALAGLADLLWAVREETERCCPGAFDHLLREFSLPEESEVLQ